MTNLSSRVVLAVVIAFAAQACGGKTNDPQAIDVGGNTGGTSAWGATGGSAPSGTSGTQTDATGGAIATGGATATGGTSQTAPSTLICGNGLLEMSEACDDANITSRDGCTSTCKIEPGYYCPFPGQRCLPLGIPPKCGNGILDDTLGETCDDGEHNGQSGYCPIDCGHPAVCGNAVIEAWNGEQCDDGVNEGAYRGCMPNCQLAPYCGNGVLEKGNDEQCDDGARNSPWPAYGGCLSSCTLAPYCGDGVVQENEECDNGAFNGQTSCTTTCRYYT